MLWLESRVEPLPRGWAIQPGSTVSYHRSRAQSGLIRIIVSLPWGAEWGLRLEMLGSNDRDRGCHLTVGERLSEHKRTSRIDEPPGDKTSYEGQRCSGELLVCG